MKELAIANSIHMIAAKKAKVIGNSVKCLYFAFYSIFWSFKYKIAGREENAIEAKIEGNRGCTRVTDICI